MKQNGGGKGSAARPLALPLEEFGEKHDAIFGARKRTNGGWTPPTLPTNDVKQMEVALPSGATVTMRTLKERPQTDGDYKLTGVYGGNEVICKIHPEEEKA